MFSITRLALATTTLLATNAAWPAPPTTLPVLAEPATEFVRRAAAPENTRCTAGDALLLPVDLMPGGNVEAVFDPASGHLRILYRMVFNQLTEGWNWHPEANAANDDYYRFKYLPIQSVIEERPGYRFEDKIGEPQDMRVRWRYDYFFAFENLYDFYPRGTDDDAGFAAEVAIQPSEAERLTSGGLRMALRGRLTRHCLSDSTTFWKATFSNPVDFTLKKRYLIGTLEEVLFYDAATQRVLASVSSKHPSHPARP
jgi:hypothetical protein